MELTCLNCSGSFSVDDGEPAGRNSLCCPLCGREQRWVPQAEFIDPSGDDVPVESNLGEPSGARADVSSGAFRRPMQAFSGLRSGKSRSSQTGPQVYVVDPDEMEIVETVGAIPNVAPQSESSSEIRLDDVAPLVEEVPALGDPESWVCRSPSGLVLEFPSSNLLLAWAAVLDNPAPYQVSRAGSLWTPLDQAIREMKRGARSTQAFLKTLDGGSVGGRPAIDPGRRARMELGDPLGKADQTVSDDGGLLQPLSRSVPSSSQFQFKIAETKPEGVPGWVVILVVAVGVLAAGGVAAYVLLLH